MKKLNEEELKAFRRLGTPNEVNEALDNAINELKTAKEVIDEKQKEIFRLKDINIELKDMVKQYNSNNYKLSEKSNKLEEKNEELEQEIENIKRVSADFVSVMFKDY